MFNAKFLNRQGFAADLMGEREGWLKSGTAHAFEIVSITRAITVLFLLQGDLHPTIPCRRYKCVTISCGLGKDTRPEKGFDDDVGAIVRSHE